MLTDNEYTQHVLARASTQWHGEQVDFNKLEEILVAFIVVGMVLDDIKKAIFYNRAPEENYLVGPLNTPPIPEDMQGIAHAILGIATEAVELVEALGAYLFDNEPLDIINLQEEAGDVQWYRALLLHHINQTHVENINQNDKKLEKRFGPVKDGFSYKSANERDLDGERDILEGKE